MAKTKGFFSSELLVPLGIVAMVATMLIPLPHELLSFLLVSNFIFSILLLMSSLYICEPLKLAVLPTLLLLATLCRLALNIATTRLILSTGNGGDVVAAFGKVVVQGNLVVGFVIFLIITLVQFMVVAKGAERVAEVSARFTLDALPGKQMSIDADVRAGIIDSDSARKKREELQAESRFYGSLDGAMKFVKGDSIAGLVITAINIIGGLAIGVFVQGLDIELAVRKYTLLTVGEGLLAQIPALLTATAAGMIVTKVSIDGKGNLASDLVSQLTSLKNVLFITALVGIAIACLPGFPAMPFLVLSFVIAVAAFLKAPEIDISLEDKPFQPCFVPPLEVLISRKSAAKIFSDTQLTKRLDEFRSKVYCNSGIYLNKPSFKVVELLEGHAELRVRGIKAVGIKEEQNFNLEILLNELQDVVAKNSSEMIDDILTRRLLDTFDHEAPELVSSVVPGVITVTQLTAILKNLIKEGLTIRYFDLILQAIAEHGSKAINERFLYEEVRVTLKRVISNKFSENEKLIFAAPLSPVLDVMLSKAEREGKEVNYEYAEMITRKVKERPIEEGNLIITSRAARKLLWELLDAKRIKTSVIAYEEVAENYDLKFKGEIQIEAGHDEKIIMELAA